MNVENRVGWVISMIHRFFGKSAARNRDDVAQIAALACLLYANDVQSCRAAKRMYARFAGFRRPVVLQLDPNQPDEPQPIEATERDKAIMARLWPILDRLASNHREAIVRVFLDDCPRQYVADEMGLTGTQLGQVLRSALKRIRVLCEAEGITWET